MEEVGVGGRAGLAFLAGVRWVRGGAPAEKCAKARGTARARVRSKSKRGHSSPGLTHPPDPPDRPCQTSTLLASLLSSCGDALGRAKAAPSQTVADTPRGCALPGHPRQCSWQARHWGTRAEHSESLVPACSTWRRALGKRARLPQGWQARGRGGLPDPRRPTGTTKPGNVAGRQAGTQTGVACAPARGAAPAPATTTDPRAACAVQSSSWAAALITSSVAAGPAVAASSTTPRRQ